MAVDQGGPFKTELYFFPSQEVKWNIVPNWNEILGRQN